MSQIAKRLGRSKSTISEELKRNKIKYYYDPKRANHLAKKRRKIPRTPSKLNNSEINAFVQEHLAMQWSPQQISARMKLNHPDRNDMNLSYHAIYRWIEKDRKLGGEWYRNLRLNHHKKRRPRTKKARNARIANRTMIDKRPIEVDQKIRVGDWEGDTVCGPRGSTHALVTLVERSTRFTEIMLIPNKQALTLNAAVKACFGRLRSGLPRQTVTVDNGLEFAGHEALSKAIGAEIYFAYPGHCWERGLNENTNGLIRQYFPKGTDFSRVRPSQVAKVAALLNNRPRRSLGYRTPAEAIKSSLPT